MLGLRLSWYSLAVAFCAIVSHLLLFLYLCADYVPELSCIKSLLLMLVDLRRSTGRVHKKKLYSIADMLEEKVDANPKLVQFVTAEDGRDYTLEQIEDFANRIANWGTAKGLCQQNTVALMLFNRPEYVGFWFGMAKIGCTTALLNTNLSCLTFTHSVQVAIGTAPCKLL